MSHPTPEAPQLASLARAAKRTAWRLACSATLKRAVTLGPWPIGYAALALAYIKIEAPGPRIEGVLLWVGAAILLGCALLVSVTCFRRRARWAGARTLDRHHGLDDRVTNALCFAAVDEANRSAMMKLAIVDGLAAGGRLSPRRAAPVRLPPELFVVAASCGGLAVLAATEVPRGHFEEVLRPEAPPQLLARDDLDLFRDAAEKLETEAKEPETKASVRRFNRLIEDIAERRLDRREAFARLTALEGDLNQLTEQEKQATREGLRALAKELERSELSKPVAKALAEERLEDAEEAMRKLALRMKQNRNPPSGAELERLRQSLEKASQVHSQKRGQLEKELERLGAERRSLLKKKREKGSLPAAERKRLAKLERRLERLERERKASARTEKQLSELDKKLAEAARALMELQKEAGAQSLEEAAEDINRAARQELTRKQKERLLKQLQALRELLRQQGASGAKRADQLKRFGQKARGQGETGRRGARALMPRRIPGGAHPGPAGSGGTQRSSGQQGSEPASDGSRAGDKQWGTGHDPNLSGNETQLDAQTRDVSAAAVDTQEGAASSEVIAGAATRGFVGEKYQDVYTDYQNVAERVLEEDEVPPGYRFYVRRYFQLIRPRE